MLVTCKMDQSQNCSKLPIFRQSTMAHIPVPRPWAYVVGGEQTKLRENQEYYFYDFHTKHNDKLIIAGGWDTPIPKNGCDIVFFVEEIDALKIDSLLSDGYNVDTHFHIMLPKSNMATQKHALRATMDEMTLTWNSEQERFRFPQHSSTTAQLEVSEYSPTNHPKQRGTSETDVEDVD